MNDTGAEPLEFTKDELRAALECIGKDARQRAFAAGLPVMVAKDGQLVLQYADGREEIVGTIHPEPKVNGSR